MRGVSKFGNSIGDGGDDTTSKHVTVTIEHENYLSRVGPGLNYDAKNKRIVNLAPPANDFDAVTLRYVKTKLGIQRDADGNLNLEGRGRIVDVAEPINSSDVVTKQFLEKSRQLRIFTFFYNSDAWSTAGGRNLIRLTRAGQIEKVVVLSATPGDQFRVGLAVGGQAMPIGIRKTAGEVCTVTNHEKYPIPFEIGHTFTLINDTAMPSGEHTIEIYCRMNE
jgi:hypothetical protein